MIGRRAFIAAIPAVFLSRSDILRAQSPSGPPGGGGYYMPETANIEHISQDYADWFSDLKRPDIMDNIASGSENFVGTVKSCCDAGDGYPIQILEEAWPPHTGHEENGRAKVTDPSAKMLILPNGFKKYRAEMKGPLEFKFAADKVVREKEGNPTKTAWVFCSTEFYNAKNPGYMNKVYCVVPLPPGF